MAPKFFSKEWCESFKNQSNADADYRQKMKGYTVKLTFIATDCPDGNDVMVLWDYIDGELIGFEYNKKPAPSDLRIGKGDRDELKSFMKNQASYDTFAKILKNEINTMQALSEKKVQIEGDMVEIVKLTNYNTLMRDKQATIPVEY